MKKYIIIILVSLSLITTIGFLIKSYNKRIFQSGIDYCKSETSKANDDLRRKLTQESEKRIKEALKKKSKDDEEAVKIVQEIKNVKPIVKQSEIDDSNITCNDLGSEFAELYDNAIGRKPSQTNSADSKDSR